MQRDIRKYFINLIPFLFATPPIEKKLHELFLIVVSPVSPVALWLVFNGRLRLICKNSRGRPGFYAIDSVFRRFVREKGAENVICLSFLPPFSF